MTLFITSSDLGAKTGSCRACLCPQVLQKQWLHSDVVVKHDVNVARTKTKTMT